MTIRVEQLVFSDREDLGYLTDGDDTPCLPDVLSMMRHIFRDRSDMDMIPVINGVTATKSPNQYGHDLFIDVTYSKSGYRATYAARRGSGPVTKFTCYMD